MNLAKSGGLSLLPKSDPDVDGIEDYKILLDKESDLEDAGKRALLWTHAVDTGLGDSWLTYPGAQFATFGLADPDNEQNVFAVFVYCRGKPEPSKEVGAIVVSGEKFPIFRRFYVEEKHQLKPANGRTTCWVKSRKQTPPIKNHTEYQILMAKHVVDPNGNVAIGDFVPFSFAGGATRAEVSDVAPGGVDSVVVIRPLGTDAPQNLRPLSIERFVAQWSDATIHAGRKIGTKVTEALLGRGTLHPMVPLRFFLADTGHHGDSGALVTDNAGRGIGIYIGRLMTPQQQPEGICQHLAQVARTLELTLYN